MLGLIVSLLLLFLALFAKAPIFSSSVGSLLYTLFYFITNESHEVHNAQEFENRFWTILAVLFSTAVIFARDSPLAFGLTYPTLGFIGVLICGYGMHIWDRNMHRMEIGKLVHLRRDATTKSLDRLHAMGIEEQLDQIGTLLSDLDQFYVPSTFNNFINKASVIKKERDIISIFEDAEPRALNFLICRCRLALLFYKIKDHRSFNQQHRTQLIELFSIERISQLTVHSRVIVLHALQMMKLPANTRAEHCVRNIMKNTTQDDLSDLKTLTDAKGDYFCMTKLIYDDIKSDIVREEILNHIEKQARIQNSHMALKTKWSKERKKKFWRKVLSDVDDTLTCSGGSYPKGIDKRYGKAIVYPGVLGFYRELDLGNEGPEEWPTNTVGNLVFLSARPHVYKDVSEKVNFGKFEKLVSTRGMHTMPSLLAGDVTSGLETLMKNDFEPLAQKKFNNFQKYVSIYPEFRHVFIGDNGQGDVRAAELMVEAYPKQVEAIYVHLVQKLSMTYKYFPEKWADKTVKPFFFKTYPEAALDAAKRNFIRVRGLRRICIGAINDFYMIQTKEWPSEIHKCDRRDELNQALWSCNEYLKQVNEETIPLLDAERLWKNGQKVKTPFGNGTILSFDSVFDLYEISLDWRPLNVQILEQHKEDFKEHRQKIENTSTTTISELPPDVRPRHLETVFEADDEDTTLSPRPRSVRNISSLGDSLVSTNVPSLIDDREMIPISLLDTDKVEESESSEATEEVEKIIPSQLSPKVKTHYVTAKIHGKFIKPYQPPQLPVFLKGDDSKKVFSFWGSRGESLRVKSRAKQPFNHREKCNTPFGPGFVLAYRTETEVVVVEMIGWKATCYLSAEAVNKSDEEGFFGSLLRKMTTTPDPKISKQRRPSSPKEIESPISKDIILNTPFGEGKVTIPKKTDTMTVGISLTSWKLANNTHPILYCTQETALDWKISDFEGRSKNSGGIFSAIGSIVSLGKKLIKKTIPAEIVVPCFERYYMDGAAVTTSFGNGVVRTFRDEDGFYEVTLVDWKLANNICAKIYVTKESLTYQKAVGCQEGYAVLTSLGISGILESIEHKTGVHIVSVHSSGMVCYLQPKDIVMPLKAAVSEDVLTQYGNGKVVKYRACDKVYEISLDWAKLYAQAEAIERDSNLDVRGTLKMSWVSKLFFSSDLSTRDVKDTFNGSQRSRSNSITSLRTQNSRTLLS